jgi:hypothetical protein
LPRTPDPNRDAKRALRRELRLYRSELRGSLTGNHLDGEKTGLENGSPYAIERAIAGLELRGEPAHLAFRQLWFRCTDRAKELGVRLPPLWEMEMIVPRSANESGEEIAAAADRFDRMYFRSRGPRERPARSPRDRGRTSWITALAETLEVPFPELSELKVYRYRHDLEDRLSCSLTDLQVRRECARLRRLYCYLEPIADGRWATLPLAKRTFPVDRETVEDLESRILMDSMFGYNAHRETDEGMLVIAPPANRGELRGLKTHGNPDFSYAEQRAVVHLLVRKLTRS